MLLVMKRKKVISVLVIAVVAIISFIICDLAIDANASATGLEGEDANVASLEEAEQIAGYEVAVPKLIPAEYEKSDTISVLQLHISTGGPESRAVQQEWVSPDGLRVALVQFPGLSMPLKGESVKIGEVMGAKVFLEAAQGRPSLIALYWRDGDMGYSLCGPVPELLSEQELIDIAVSVSTE